MSASSPSNANSSADLLKQVFFKFEMVVRVTLIFSFCLLQEYVLCVLTKLLRGYSGGSDR